ncbi:MAG: hypothetical protein RI897_2084 [Verrucomicrobiota bacterium]
MHGGGFDEGGALLVGGGEVPGEDAGDGALVVERDVEEEAGAGALGDVVEFFPEGVAVGDAERGVGVADVAGAVVAHDGAESAATGYDAFGAAAEAGEEVGFDEAGDDADIGLDEVPVEEGGGAVASGAELDECIRVFGFVVEDAITPDDFGGEERFEFGLGIGAVGAELVDERDAIGVDVLEVFEEPGDEAVVRGGAGDVAEGDADCGVGLDPFAEGWGVDGVIQGVEDGGFFVGQTGGVLGLDDGDVGVVEVEGEVVSAVGESDGHGGVLVRGYWLGRWDMGYGRWDMGYWLTVRGLRACGVRELGVRGWALRGAGDGRGWGLVHGLGGCNDLRAQGTVPLPVRG